MVSLRATKRKTPIRQNVLESSQIFEQMPEQTPDTLKLIDKRFQLLETIISTFISIHVKNPSTTSTLSATYTSNATPTSEAKQLEPSLMPALPQPQSGSSLMPAPPHMLMNIKGPKPFKGDEGTLEKILFQMDEYFPLYKYVANDDKLATLALYLEGLVLDWWRQKKPSFVT